jgi:hypothetical protein
LTALRFAVAVTVTIVWAIANLAPYFTEDAPSPPAALSGMMLFVVGYCLSRAGIDVVKTTVERAKRVQEAWEEPPDETAPPAP